MRHVQGKPKNTFKPFVYDSSAARECKKLYCVIPCHRRHCGWHHAAIGMIPSTTPTLYSRALRAKAGHLGRQSKEVGETRC